MYQEKLLTYIHRSDATLELAAKYSVLLGVTAAVAACFINLV